MRAGEWISVPGCRQADRTGGRSRADRAGQRIVDRRELQQDNVPGADRYALLAREAVGSAPIAGFEATAFGFRLDAPSGSAIGGALTLLAAPNLADFGSSTFCLFLFDGENLEVVFGALSSLDAAGTAVSAPATAPLVSLGPLGLGGVRRRRG